MMIQQIGPEAVYKNCISHIRVFYIGVVVVKIDKSAMFATALKENTK